MQMALVLPSGAVAQLGERGLCKPEVVGSIPISSTNDVVFETASWCRAPRRAGIALTDLPAKAG
jgi:hypothetical protein